MSELSLNTVKSPCFACPDRRVTETENCHNTCEAYLAFRAKADAANREKKKWIDLNNHKWARTER